MSTNSLSFRLIATASGWAISGLIIAGLVVSNLFATSVERSFDSRLELHLKTLIAMTEINDAGKLAVLGAMSEPQFGLPFSGWYWQITPRAPGSAGSLVSRSLWDQLLPTLPPDPAQTAAPAAHFGYMDGPQNQNLRALERIINLPKSDSDYIFTMTGNASEITGQLHTFNGTLIISLIIIALGLVAAVLVQVRVGLAPLTQLREALSDIRRGAANTLSGDYPAELAPLAKEMNNLIQHNEDVIARAKRDVGNLAHALKTPLAVLANEAQSKTGIESDLVLKQTHAMRDQIEHHLSRARIAARADVIGTRTSIEPVLAGLTRTLERIHQDKNITVHCDCRAGLAFQGNRQDLEDMAGNLLDNAYKWAKTQIIISCAPGPDTAIIMTIEDDGPGVAADKHAQMLHRGQRLDETVPGSGLGLSIVDELARLYRGSISLEKSERLSGLKASLILPAAEG